MNCQKYILINYDIRKIHSYEVIYMYVCILKIKYYHILYNGHNIEI